MLDYIPYTYLIEWSEHNIRYYGAKYGQDANPDTFWTNYFTSSSEVSAFRETYGEPDHREIRKTFPGLTMDEGAEKALAWENRALKFVNAAKNPKYLNRSNGGPWNTAGMANYVDPNGVRYFLSNNHPDVVTGKVISIRRGAKTKTVACQYCGIQVAINMRPTHEKTCSDNPNRQRLETYGKSKNFTEKACQFCHKLFLSPAVKNHERACELNPNKTKQVRKPPTFNYKSCEFCKESFTPHQIKRHEMCCESNPNKSNHPNVGFVYDRSSCQHCREDVASNSLVHHEKTCKKNPNRIPGRGAGSPKKKKQCQYCQEHYAVNVLSRHERRCPKR